MWHVNNNYPVDVTIDSHGIIGDFAGNQIANQNEVRPMSILERLSWIRTVTGTTSFIKANTAGLKVIFFTMIFMTFFVFLIIAANNLVR